MKKAFASLIALIIAILILILIFIFTKPFSLTKTVENVEVGTTRIEQTQDVLNEFNKGSTERQKIEVEGLDN